MAVLLLGAGCKHDDAPAPAHTADAAPALDCARVIGAAMKRRIAEAGATYQQDSRHDAIQAAVDQMVTRVTATCGADAWSPELLRCVDAARTMTDFQGCAHLLTAAQRKALDASDDPGVPSVWIRLGIEQD